MRSLVSKHNYKKRMIVVEKYKSFNVIILIFLAYGGTMIPSEGLNCRSISIELLTEIQNLRPKFEDYYISN